MKKYTYLLLIAVVLQINLFGQGLSFNVKNVVMSGAANDPGAFLKEILVTNNSTTDSVFSWTRVDQNGPSQWNFVLCDPFGCYDPVPATADFTLSSGAKSKIKLDILSNNVAGNGKLAIAVFPKNNASKADTITFNINVWNLGLDKNKVQPEILLFPNPVKDEITLSFEGKTNLTVEIISLVGSRVKVFNQVSHMSKLDISHIQDGIYIIRIHDGTKTYTRRITKS